LKISVMHTNLRKPFDEVLELAGELELDGLHIACGGPLDARTCSSADRKAVLKQLKDHHLECSAVCCWGGEVDLGETEHHAVNIAWGKQVLQMAIDLDCTIWMGHVGVMPHDTSAPTWQAFVDATGELARYAESLGACLAMETGPEPPRIMKALIETVGGTGLRVNYDPANLVLWPPILIERGVIDREYDKDWAIGEWQPVDGVKTIGQYIVHTHAKDAMVDEAGKRKEVPLGEGFIEWPRYLRLLQEQGFDGYLAIERETGADPVGDIRRAATFLRGQLAAL